MRLRELWLGLVTMGGLALAQGAAGAVTVTEAIPAQPVTEALSSLSRQTGLQVVWMSSVAEGVKSSAVPRGLSAEAALTRLLEATGLAFEFLNERTVTVFLKGEEKAGGKVSDSMEVEATLRMASDSSEGAENKTTTGAATSEEEAGSKIQEIVVTATKRQERVQDIPMSIAVIGGQDIERRGLIGMEDYLRSIPNVNQIDQGPTGNAIIIRGVSSSPEEENANSGTTVGTYFGETPITAAGGMSAGGIDIRPVDIERIEVLRGPQGTAYGSASLGGTLRIIPAAPKLDDFSGKLAANYSNTSGFGSDNTMIQGVVNIPVIEDKVAVRAVGYRYEESGFYRNIAGLDPAAIARAENSSDPTIADSVRGFTQDHVGRAISTGGRLAALWQPTDKLNISLNILTQEIEQDGVPAANGGSFEQTVSPIAVAGRIRGQAGEAADAQIDLAGLVVNYDLGWATLTSANSWIDSGSARNRDLTIAFGIPHSITLSSDFESFTSEMRLASRFEGRFQVLGGLFYENVDEHSFYTVDWPGSPATNPFVTNPSAIFDNMRKLDQRAVFGEVSYDLTEKLTASVGGRFFKYKKDAGGLVEGGLFGIPLGTGVPGHAQGSDDGSSLKANLSYKPTKDSLLYATWADGFRLGPPDGPGLSPVQCDTNNDGLVDGSNISLESTKHVNSDFLDNYEIGGKFALFDRRLVVDTAVYHIKWDGLPVRTVVDCSGTPLAFTTNAGGATSEGVEFQASLLVVEGLKLDFGGSYNKAELSKDALDQGWHEGDRLPGSPKVSVNLAAQYDFDVAGYKAFMRADSLYAGKFYGDFLQSPRTMAGDYIKLNVRAGVEIRNLGVELFVRNLTNEDSFTWRGLTSAPIYSSDYQLRPRTVGIQLGYSFE